MKSLSTEQHFRDCRVIVGVTGSIAAYKSVELVRQLRAKGVQVRVVMTDSAKEFITPLTLQAVSGHGVRDSLLDPSAEAGMDHIELARWADYICIAPASAHTIAKLTTGMADDLLTTLCLASRAKQVIAPAMNQQMWEHPATQRNIAQLQATQAIMWVGPVQGEQACGEVGQGRMSAPEDIVAALLEDWQATLASHADKAAPGRLQGQTILITAGPTIEAFDPVRYITNHSTGKMGYALAQAAIEAGAKVTLVSGPTSLITPNGVLRLDVASADEMYQSVQSQLASSTIFIGCAAVANYRPAARTSQKQHHGQETVNMTLTRNRDILATVAHSKGAPFCVGFCAETDDLLERAHQKLHKKGVALMIANQVGQPGSGFNSDQNEVIMLSHTEQLSWPRMPKKELAVLLIEQIATAFYQSKGETPC